MSLSFRLSLQNLSSFGQSYDVVHDSALETTFIILMIIYGLVTAAYFFGNLEEFWTENPEMVEYLTRVRRLERRIEMIKAHLCIGGPPYDGDDPDDNDDNESRTENPRMVELWTTLRRLERKMEMIEAHLRIGEPPDDGDDRDDNDDDDDNYVDAASTFGDEHIHRSPPQRPPSPPLPE